MAQISEHKSLCPVNSELTTDKTRAELSYRLDLLQMLPCPYGIAHLKVSAPLAEWHLEEHTPLLQWRLIQADSLLAIHSSAQCL